MIIRYTGVKPSKRIDFRSTTQGLNQFTFDPTCDIDDEHLIKHLLHRDMRGLFIEEKPKKDVKAPATDEPPEESHEDPIEEVPEKEEIETPKKKKKKKKRGE